MDNNTIYKHEHDISKWFQSTPDYSSSKYYSLGSRSGPKRGRCVILNYEYFLNPDKTRKGTEFDVSALKKTFELLNFEIKIHHDMTKRGTEFILDNESQLDHSPYHCFVLCVLSHGVVDKFLCIDDEGIEYEQVFAYFDGSSCPSLVGKPKLFFFQACQGEKHDSGVRLTVDSAEPHCFQAQSSSLIDKPDNPLSHPITADQFAFYSCYRSFNSIRNPEKGSWFISELTSTFDKYFLREDLIGMATIVQNKVAKKEAARVTVREETAIKQMPLYFSTLVKKLNFS